MTTSTRRPSSASRSLGKCHLGRAGSAPAPAIDEQLEIAVGTGVAPGEGAEDANIVRAVSRGHPQDRRPHLVCQQLALGAPWIHCTTLELPRGWPPRWDRHDPPARSGDVTEERGIPGGARPAVRTPHRLDRGPEGRPARNGLDDPRPTLNHTRLDNRSPHP